MGGARCNLTDRIAELTDRVAVNVAADQTYLGGVKVENLT